MDNNNEGYIKEIFTSFQGEGGSIEESCQGKRQIFIRFAGCNIANKDFGTTGCSWCDTQDAKTSNIKIARIEKKAGTSKFLNIKNPVTTEQVIKIVDNLKTPDIHSISLTGGEPLSQITFLKNLANKLKDKGYRLYLETNGSLIEEAKKVKNIIDYACVDIKDETSNAAVEWKDRKSDV